MFGCPLPVRWECHPRTDARTAGDDWSEVRDGCSDVASCETLSGARFQCRLPLHNLKRFQAQCPLLSSSHVKMTSLALRRHLLGLGFSHFACPCLVPVVRRPVQSSAPLEQVHRMRRHAFHSGTGYIVGAVTFAGCSGRGLPVYLFFVFWLEIVAAARLTAFHWSFTCDHIRKLSVHRQDDECWLLKLAVPETVVFGRRSPDRVDFVQKGLLAPDFAQPHSSCLAQALGVTSPCVPTCNRHRIGGEEVRFLHNTVHRRLRSTGNRRSSVQCPRRPTPATPW